MGHEDNQGAVPERPDFDQLTDEQKLSLLEANARVARLQLEELAGQGVPNELWRQARIKKQVADAALVELQVELGIIQPPDELS